MSTKHIHNTFLITKPQHQAKNLCKQIENSGGHCILLPTLAIKSLSPEQIAQTMTALSPIDKVIFTSANAVYPVMPYWKEITTVPAIFAVGPGTAKALASFHITAKVPTEFNSEGLLALPDLQAIQQQHIVIFSGEGGRELLQQELKKRGAAVQKIAVYKRERPMLTTVFPPAEDISLIISTSEESLKNLWEMVGLEGQAWLREQRLLVISAKMEILAQQLGFKQTPIKASNASDEAILEVILKTMRK